MAAVLWMVGLAEGETIISTYSKCKVEHRAATATLHPSRSLVNMSGFFFITYLIFYLCKGPLSRVLQTHGMSVDSLKFIITSFCCFIHLLIHLIKLSLGELIDSVNYPKAEPLMVKWEVGICSLGQQITWCSHLLIIIFGFIIDKCRPSHMALFLFLWFFMCFLIMKDIPLVMTKDHQGWWWGDWHKANAISWN